MLHLDTGTWIQIIVYVISIVTIVVSTRMMVNQNTARIQKLETRVLPENTDNQFVTKLMCEKCQTECRLRNRESFHELMEMARENSKMLCAMVGDIGEIKGEIKGMSAGVTSKKRESDE